MCYNEELLLPFTLKHYRNRFPSAHFVLVDNNSTDRSHEIAKENNMEIRYFDSENKQCEELMMHIRNTIWNDIQDGWVIMCDMDEWLEINEEQLLQEELKGTTIITTEGFEIIGDSTIQDLSDINIFELNKGVRSEDISKRILFKVPDVKINFWWGAHKCFPQGNVKYSESKYILKHMNILGQEYLIKKYKNRYDRNHKMRSRGMNCHYLIDHEKIIQYFNDMYKQRIDLPTYQTTLL